LIDVVTLDEKVRKSSECQVAAGKISLRGLPEREWHGPSDFKSGPVKVLLQRGVIDGYKLCLVRFPIEQQKNAPHTNVQGIGLAADGTGFFPLPFNQFIDAGASDGKSNIDPAIAPRPGRQPFKVVVHRQFMAESRWLTVPCEFSEDSVDKVAGHKMVAISKLSSRNSIDKKAIQMPVQRRRSSHLIAGFLSEIPVDRSRRHDNLQNYSVKLTAILTEMDLRAIVCRSTREKKCRNHMLTTCGRRVGDMCRAEMLGIACFRARHVAAYEFPCQS
jgi:hypothetical protein